VSAVGAKRTLGREARRLRRSTKRPAAAPGIVVGLSGWLFHCSQMDLLAYLLEPFVMASLGACCVGIAIVLGGLHARRGNRLNLRLGAVVLAGAAVVGGLLTMMVGIGLLIWRFMH